MKLSNLSVVLTFCLPSCLKPRSWKLDRSESGCICDQQPCEKSALSSSVMHVSVKFTFPLQMTISCCISPLLCALLFKPVINFLFHYKRRRLPHGTSLYFLSTNLCVSGPHLFSHTIMSSFCQRQIPPQVDLIIFFSVLLKVFLWLVLLSPGILSIFRLSFAFFILTTLFVNLPTSFLSFRI